MRMRWIGSGGIAACALFCVLGLSGQQATTLTGAGPHAAVPSAPRAGIGPETGALNGRVYRNQYFAFTYTFFPGWVSLRPANWAEDYADGVDHGQYLLLNAIEPPTPGRLARIVIVANRLQKPETAQQHMAEAVSQQKRAGRDVSGPEAIVADGRTLWAIRSSDKIPGSSQTLYAVSAAMVERGYVVRFTVMGSSKAIVQALQATLAELQFGPVSGPLQEAGATPPSVVKAAGTIQGGVYTNTLLGLRYTLPAGLPLMSEQAVEEIADRGHRARYHDNPATDPAHEAAERETIDLAAAGTGVSDAPGQMMLLMAVNDAALPALTLREAARAEGMALAREVGSEKPARVDIKQYGVIRAARAALTFQVTTGKHTEKEHMSTLMLLHNGYMLVWMFEAPAKDGLKALEQTMKSVRLGPAASAAEGKR